MTSSFASSLSFLNMTPNSAPFVQPSIVGSTTNVHHPAPKQEYSIQPQVAPTPQSVVPTYFMQSSCPNYSYNRNELSSRGLTNNSNNNNQSMAQSQSSFVNQSKSNLPIKSGTTSTYKNMHSSIGQAASFVGAAAATELRGFTQVLPSTQSTATHGALYDKITNKISANNISNTTNDNMNLAGQRKVLKRSLSTFVSGGAIDTSESSITTNKASLAATNSIVNQPPSQQQQYEQILLPKQPAINGIARSPQRRSTTKESISACASQTSLSSFADLVASNQKKPPIVLNPYSVKTIKVLTEIPQSNPTMNPSLQATYEFENRSLSSLQNQLDRLNPRMMSSSMNNKYNCSATVTAANNLLSSSNQKMPRIQGLARSKSRNLTMTSVGSITLDNINNSSLTTDSPLKKQMSIEFGGKDMFSGNNYPMSQSVSVLKECFDTSDSVRGSVVVRPAKMPSTTFFVDAPADEDGVVDQADLRTAQPATKLASHRDSQTVAIDKKKEGDEFIQNLFGKLHAIDEEHQNHEAAVFAPTSEHDQSAQVNVVDPHHRLRISCATNEDKRQTLEESTSEFKYTYRQNSKSPSKLGRNASSSPMKSAIALAVDAASANLLPNPINSLIIHAKKVPVGSDEGSFGTAIETLYNTPSFVYLKEGNRKTSDYSESPLSSPVVAVRTGQAIAQNSQLQQQKQQQSYQNAPSLQLQFQPKQLLRSYSNATTELSTEMDSPDSALTHLSFPSDSVNVKAAGHKSQQVLSASSSGVSSPNEFVMYMLPAGTPVPFLRMAPQQQQQSSLSSVSKNY